MNEEATAPEYLRGFELELLALRERTKQQELSNKLLEKRLRHMANCFETIISITHTDNTWGSISTCDLRVKKGITTYTGKNIV